MTESLCCAESQGLATGVDFGTIKVKEESKQTFTIKNKGKYEIMFK